jgi:hypothetical protein
MTRRRVTIERHILKRAEKDCGPTHVDPATPAAVSRATSLALPVRRFNDITGRELCMEHDFMS